jgi:putative membrane protein insertion efficiency factor
MKAALEKILKVYKHLVSPLLPPACRYVPTCSEYAAEAVARHGIFRGTMLACWRLLRCNPLARGGFDPVPKKKLETII